MGAHRFAIYFVPRPESALARAAVGWLGRDIETGAAHPAVQGPETAVATPRRYGFHATLKPPFRLAPERTEAELYASVADLAASRPEVALPLLGVARIGRFLALVTEAPDGDVAVLADRCVRALDAFRAPADAAETARRAAAGLTPRQGELLRLWGHPYVLDEFRFHMTLTGDVDEAAAAILPRELAGRFADAVAAPLTIEALTLAVEPTPGADFLVAARFPLGG